MPPVLEILKFSIFGPFDLLRIVPLLKREPNPILYSTTRFTHVLVMIINLFLRSSWIAHVHSNEKSKFLMWFMGFVLRRASRVIFVSNFLNSLYDVKRSMVLYNPVDLVATSSNNENSQEIQFAFVGNLMEWKGISIYLEAAAQFLKTNNNVAFHVFGFGKNLGELIEQFPQIQFHGQVERGQLYSKFDILVLPSIDANLVQWLSWKALQWENYVLQRISVDKKN